MSADDRFDELGKALAASTSRRRFLKVAAAAAAGAVLSVVRAPEAAASHNRKCRDLDQNCTSDAECCTHFCSNFHCACATVCPGATKGTVTTECCAPGDVCCPGGGTTNGTTVQAQCVEASKTLCPTGQTFSSSTCKCETLCTKICTAPLVLNTTTCTCECPTAQVCGNSCCNVGQKCCPATGTKPAQCKGLSATC